jgi:hypothetical protein
MRLALLVTSLFLLNSFRSDAQIIAYSSRSVDNNCQLVYMVNNSDSIFYIKGLTQEKLNYCQTFTQVTTDKVAYEVNLSEKDNNYLLLLPKDTIIYRVLVPAASLDQPKKLLVQTNYSDKVIKTNDEKKRNKKIKKLKPTWVTLEVAEK